jgi:tetrapyrrole methylase family protein / MazG family protein
MQGITHKDIEAISVVSKSLITIRNQLIPQITIVDGESILDDHHPSFPPNSPTLITNINSIEIVRNIKFNLLNVFPEQHPVKLVHNAGSNDCIVEEFILQGIDKSPNIGVQSTLFIPPMRENTSFEGFQELISHLRSPVGCAWDREQTHLSLRENLLEETHEVLEAIDNNDTNAMKEEFGDLLLQIVLQSQIAYETGSFTMEDIIEGIYTKLVRRHPHVFGDKVLGNAQEIIQNWEKLKEQERKDNGEEMIKGILSGISKTLPALSVANNYQKRAARVGFDFPVVDGALNKLREEINEFMLAEGDFEKEDEMGDIAFGLVNIARWHKIDLETALRKTNVKFRYRFEFIEKEARKRGNDISVFSLSEMDELWDKAKKEKK